MLARHSTLVAAPVALLAAAFMLGCQEAPTELADADSPRFAPNCEQSNSPQCDGDGGGDDGGSTSDSAALDLGADSNGDGLGDAMITSESQVLEVEEKKDILRLFTGDGFTFSGEHNFDDTRAAAEAEFSDGSFEGDKCLVKKKGNRTIEPAKIDSALRKLTDPEQKRKNFNLRVDKNALGGTSEDHKIFSNWDAPNGSDWTLNVRPSKVTLLSGDINADATLQYTGGSVSVKARSENPSFTVVCPVATEDANGDGGVGDVVEAAIDRL